MAAFVGKDEALCFSTGFTVNSGVIPQLLTRDDFIICDDRDHASIVDGRRLSFAKALHYKHNDMKDLERCLRRCPKNSVKLIVVDGVFSMEGDLCKLPEIVGGRGPRPRRLRPPGPRRLRPLQPDEGHRHHHGDVLQVPRLHRRFRRGGQDHHQLAAAHRPHLHLQRLRHPGRHGQRPRSPAHHPERAPSASRPSGTSRTMR